MLGMSLWTDVEPVAIAHQIDALPLGFMQIGINRQFLRNLRDCPPLRDAHRSLVTKVDRGSSYGSAPPRRELIGPFGCAFG